MITLGVNASPKTAFLAVADEGKIVDAEVSRIDVASQYEASAELLATLDEVRRAYDRIKPERIAILKPELTYRAAYDEAVARVALETLLRIAAVQGDVPVELLARPTARSRLGLPLSGKLRSHVSAAVPEVVGKYWNEGRDLAALAALAAAKS